MTTTDNFQGEEADIILLSLVRSNADGKAGFVKIANRICVGLSRARHGMYVIGNMQMMDAASELWRRILRDVRDRGRIGDHLLLQCPVHTTDQPTEVRTANDFLNCPHGGCSKPCGQTRDCGHVCKLLCHPVQHAQIRCLEICAKPRPVGCTHSCGKACWEDCGACRKLVKKTRVFCGHTISVQCHADPDQLTCTATCGTAMLCGHSCPDKCHPNGHDAARYKCTLPCARTRICGHSCPKKCHESCGDCLVTVKRALKCGHSADMPCHVDPSTVTCTERCSQLLRCLHRCTQICGAPCDVLCPEIVKKTALLCQHKPKHWVEVPCHQDVTVCERPCKEKLPCGHACSGLCRECLPPPLSAPGTGSGSGSGSVDIDTMLSGESVIPPRHASCTKECSRPLGCNHKCRGKHNCGDGTSCPPCDQPCAIACSHHRCTLKCGESCEPCSSPCGYRCPHMYCSALCSEPHMCIPVLEKEAQTPSSSDADADATIVPVSPPAATCTLCEEKCSKPLPCGHACLGLCGEVCPTLCMVCDVETVLKRASTPKLPSARGEALFIQLACGHAFGKTALDAYVQRVLSQDQPVSLNNTSSANTLAVLGRVPGCPECGKTIVGVYRYQPDVVQRLHQLEPQHHVLSQEEALITEVEEDLRLNHIPASAIVEQLETMLAASASGAAYRKLGSALSLMLGKAYECLGKKSEALRCFASAAEQASSADIRREALLCCALLHLRLRTTETDPVLNIGKLQEKYLDSALQYLVKCEQLDAAVASGAHSLPHRGGGRQLFPRPRNCDIANLVQVVQDKKQEIKDERDAAIATQRAHALATQALLQQQQLQQQQHQLQQQLASTAAGTAPGGAPLPAVAPPPVTAAASVTAPGTRSQSSTQPPVRLPPPDGSALHVAAARGRLQEVQLLVADGADPYQRDSLGNTPLLCAAENACSDVVEFLAKFSPWHTINGAHKTFLDIVLGSSTRSSLSSDLVDDIEEEALNALQDDSDPSKSWAAAKYFNRSSCSPLEKLMDMIGIRTVKSEALKLYQNIKTDLKRPVEARIATKQALNFLFLGNPGSGKTTVARIFADVLCELGIRKDKFVETTAQKLLQEGQSKFPALLASATPGVLFIDEIYQLDPKGNADGQAITNLLMDATENDRDKLTVIVAGYKQNVMEKWVQSNPGIASRFPIEVVFEDFNENELRTIFLQQVRDMKWIIERPFAPVGTGASPATPTTAPAATAAPAPVAAAGGDVPPQKTIDVARVAARRLARASNKKGFANARSVRVMVENAQRAASKRQKVEELEATKNRDVLPDTHYTTLTLVDVIGRPIDPNTSPLIQELMGMTGLDSVKQSVLGLLELARVNYESELRGEHVVDIALHRIFLGNPGTGKTTLATVYGRILNELGYLSNGEVVLVGASTLTGEYVGSTAAKVNRLMDSVKGKVLVIDEAYALGRSGKGHIVGNSFGTEALDILVERVQGGPWEDFAVILCGYEEEMLTMLRDGNPGLSRRFRIEDAFRFEDYTDDQLVTIMLSKAAEKHLHLTPDLARDAVVNVLAKQRVKKNFGNAGSVVNLLHHATETMMKRADKEKINGRFAITAPDLFEKPDPNTAVQSLNRLMNADHIRDHINELLIRVKVQEQKEGKVDPMTMLKNYIFTGAPGTGKTTVARAFGAMFHNLGLLASGEVVECKAMELIGAYVGQSAPLVRDKMDEARGGVLFIDEAYGLNPKKNVFAADSIQQLLANLTDPKYQGKMIVIMAGYQNDMEDLMRANAGLRRRFTEHLDFKDWWPDDSLHLLCSLSQRDGIELSSSLHEDIVKGFEDLIRREGWGNAGDVETVFAKMTARLEIRTYESGQPQTSFAVDDVSRAFDSLCERRPYKSATSTKRSSATRASANTTDDLLDFIYDDGDDDSDDEDLLGPAMSFDASSAPPPPPPPPSAAGGGGGGARDQPQEQGETKSSAIAEKKELLQQEGKKKVVVADKQNDRDEEEEDEDEEGFEMVEAQEGEEGEPLPDDMLWSSLDEALTEMGYDIYATRTILASRDLPGVLVALVARKVSRRPERVRPMLEAQCPVLLPRVVGLIQQIEAELERQRLLREAIERADEAERQRLKEEERKRQERELMKRVAMIGKCCAGFEWLPLGGGGYICAGGSHHVSDEQLKNNANF